MYNKEALNPDKTVLKGEIWLASLRPHLFFVMIFPDSFMLSHCEKWSILLTDERDPLFLFDLYFLEGLPTI